VTTICYCTTWFATDEILEGSETAISFAECSFPVLNVKELQLLSVAVIRGIALIDSHSRLAECSRRI
jgi:hypothetical protein